MHCINEEGHDDRSESIVELSSVMATAPSALLLLVACDLRFKMLTRMSAWCVTAIRSNKYQQLAKVLSPIALVSDVK